MSNRISVTTHIDFLLNLSLLCSWHDKGTEVQSRAILVQTQTPKSTAVNQYEPNLNQILSQKKKHNTQTLKLPWKPKQNSQTPLFQPQRRPTSPP